MRLSYTTSKQVDEVLARLGRTEDVRFSPNKRRLAVVGFAANKIAVFDIRTKTSRGKPEINLPTAIELLSPDLALPHGLDFIDDDRIIVANRSGRATIFELPAAGGAVAHQLSPSAIIFGELLSTPGSIAVAQVSSDRCRILICNNSTHTVTEHGADLNGKCSGDGTILLRKWLGVPDGISLSSSGRIAISNHDTHEVFVYEPGRQLDEHSDPDGIMRGIFYPHGVRFTRDDAFLLVADAGAPYVRVYASEGGFRGVRSPRFSLRVLSDEDFLLGRHNPQEGGPKGIDIDEAAGLLVTTGEMQPLAFFDLAALLERAGEKPPQTGAQSAAEVKFELELQHACSQALRRGEERARQAELRAAEAEGRAAAAEALIEYVVHSKSWRVTSPLRWVFARLKGNSGD
jgi:hypothetical protein